MTEDDIERSMDRLIADLTVRENALTEKIRQLSAERARVRNSRAALQMRRAGEGEPRSTIECVRAYAATLKPGDRILLGSLIRWSIASGGWFSSAHSPEVAFASALSRAAKAGYIRRPPVRGEGYEVIGTCDQAEQAHD